MKKLTIVFKNRAKKQEELMEKLERDKIEQENYFKVTQEDIDALRKKETLGK